MDFIGEKTEFEIERISSLTEDQETAKGMMVQMHDTFILKGYAGTGKAQPINTVIPTPNGEKRLSDLKIGDFIFDRFGNPTMVIGIFPQGILQNFKVTFSDGRYSYCNDSHLWTYITSKGNLKTRPLCELFNFKTKVNGRNTYHYKYRIPLNFPVEYSRDVRIDPYLLGAFIGDGCLREEYLTFSSRDEEIVKRISNILSADYKKCSSDNFSWNFYKNKKKMKTIDVFDSEHMVGKYSYEKFIPLEYMESSILNRRKMLSGLLDTDGSISEVGGRICFSTTSKRLANDVMKMAFSLGMSASIGEDCRVDKYTTGSCFTVYIICNVDEKCMIMSLKRKLSRLDLFKNNGRKKHIFNSIKIHNIEECGYEEMMCIMVDNSEQLYLTNDYIVTHNTFLLKDFLRDAPTRNITVTAPTHKAVGVANGDCTIHSYLNLKIKEVEDKQVLMPVGFADKIMRKGTVVIDEASMISRELLHYIKEAQDTFGLKIIFVGDPAQIPPVGENISPVWEIDCPTFTLKEIVRQARDSSIISLATAVRDGSAYTHGISRFVDNESVFTGGMKELTEFFYKCMNESTFPQIISYRNKIVDSSNNWARNIVMGNPTEAFLVGEEVYIRSVNEEQVHKLEDIVKIVDISKPFKYDKRRVDYPMMVNKIYIQSHKGEEDLLICASDDDQKIFQANKSAAASRAKSKQKSWGEFWKLNNSISEVKHIYALTAHRSQGSTFQNVVVNCGDISSDRLLYTAVTRAANKLFLFRQ